jgi:hypothetical protein
MLVRQLADLPAIFVGAGRCDRQKGVRRIRVRSPVGGEMTPRSKPPPVMAPAALDDELAWSGTFSAGEAGRSGRFRDRCRTWGVGCGVLPPEENLSQPGTRNMCI